MRQEKALHNEEVPALICRDLFISRVEKVETSIFLSGFLILP
ncbi:MAG: hypothetical protein JWM28_1993 [Chitinophagaceae bacterium]|nr:hypothetical protein [Chitinophagaceae bacterium]